ncbi:MAG: baseplate wedge protein 53 [Candidatus Nanopelagicales bacterium]|nr:baseplate wedge subunit [Synechococcus phage DSL-LC03]
MNYFKYLPDILYPTLDGTKNSSHDYTKIKNIFKRPSIPESVLKNYAAFENYNIIGDDRPDIVSYKYYDDPKYDWIILIANNIQNIRNEWPMTQSDLNNYLFQKYTEAQLSAIHHYETTEVKNSLGAVILKAGLKVSSDFQFNYTETIGGVPQTKKVNPVVDITNYEYELNLNDAKRSIIMIRPEFLNIIKSEISKSFRYKPSSSFIDESTIKVEDPCIPPI